MSDTIKWNELPDSQKIKLLLVHVFQCVIVEDEYLLVQHERKSEVETQYPVAYQDKKYGYWHKRDGRFQEARIFNPLWDLDTAWQIVEKLYSQDALDIRILLEGQNNEKYWVQFWSREGGKLKGYGSSNRCLNNGIAIAALRACGIEIES